MKTVITIILVLNSMLLLGQKKSRKIEIQGRLTDSISKVGVESAAIQLLALDSTTVNYAVLSDSLGRFAFKNIISQEYIAFVNCVGYVPKKIHVKKSASEKFVYLKMPLTPAIYELQEVGIEEEQLGYKTQIDKDVFIPDSLHLRNSKTGYALLKKVPGVSVKASDHSVKLYGQSNVIVLIDGVQSNRDLGAIKPIDIEKIEIISNPSVKYDSEIANIINVVLKEERKKGFKATTNLHYFTKNRFNFSNVQLDYSAPRIRIFGMAKIKLSNGLSTDSTYRISHVEGATLEYFDKSLQENLAKTYGNIFQYGLDFSLNRNTLFNFTGNYEFYNTISERYNTAIYHEDGLLYEKAKLDSYYKGENSLQNYTLYFRKRFNSKTHYIDLNSNYYSMHRNYNRENTVSTIYPDSIDFHNSNRYSFEIGSFRSKMNHFLKINSTLSIESGVEFYRREILSKLEKSFFENYKYLDTRKSIYASGNASRNDVSLQLGFRGEFSQIAIENQTYKMKSEFLPSFLVMYSFNIKSNLKAGYNRKLKYPKYGHVAPFKYYSADSSIVRQGNPHLQPQKIGSYEIKYSFKHKHTYVGATTYFRNNTDLIGVQKRVLENGVIIAQPQNFTFHQKIGISCFSQFALFKAIPVGVYVDYNKSIFENNRYDGNSYTMAFFTEIPLPMGAYLTIDISKIGREYNLYGYSDQSLLIDEITLGIPVLKDKGELSVTVLYPFLEDETLDVSWSDGFYEEAYTNYTSTTIKFGFYYYFASGKKLNKRKRELLMERDEK